jgi:hypothetical protein
VRQTSAVIGDHAVVGADTVTMVLPLPCERRLDWDAAAAAIRDVRLDVLWDTGELYPWEYWLGEVENLPGAVPAFVALRAAQGELHGYACELRGAIEHGWPDELIALETPTHTAWVTGGPSWGEPPGDLVDATIYLAEAGITNAAGFDGYTRYDGPPIEQRTFGFGDDELRLVRFGVAAAHAAEQAAGMAHPDLGATGAEWLDAWLGELGHRDHTASAEGQALLRFAARGLALCAWLKDPAIALASERLDECGLELARVADEGGLDDRPRRRAWSAAARECHGLVADIAGWFDVLDDPGEEDDEAVAAFVAGAGGTLGDAIEVQVMAHAVFAAVASLADLSGDDVAALLDAPPSPIASNPPRESERRFAPLDQYLSLVLVGNIDWAAAERAVDALPSGRRDERRADLAEFKRLVTVREYRRFATSSGVGNAQLFIAAPVFADGPDVAVSIGRLGADAIMDAGGVACWSAPDLDFRGPVQPFVAGYGPRRTGGQR